jgi:hypothetical protein
MMRIWMLQVASKHGYLVCRTTLNLIPVDNLDILCRHNLKWLYERPNLVLKANLEQGNMLGTGV